MEERIANLHIGVQALRTFLTRGRTGDSWAEAMERLDLSTPERTALSELLERVTLPSYISPGSLRRLRLDHEQATIVGTATVAYATFLLLGGGRGADDGADDRVPAIGASIPRLTSMLVDGGSPDPTRLRERLDLIHRVARGEAALPAFEMPDEDARGEDTAAESSSPSTGSTASEQAAAGLRVAGRSLPRGQHRDPTESLPSCLFALRAWSRDEGLGHIQIARAIRFMKAGPAEKDALRNGFRGLVLPLSSPSPNAVLDTELDQASLRALGIGVVVYGRVVLSRYERMRSALALGTMQGRSDRRLQAGVDRDSARLEELEPYLTLLLPGLDPGPADEDRVYPGLLLLRDGIEEALRPSAIEEIAKATVSGSMPAVLLDNDGGPPAAADDGASTSPAVALRPTLGLALHGLDIWSRGGTFLPTVDAAIQSTDFPPGLRGWFERGSESLSKLPPDFDPVALADADIDDAGMVAAGMGTLVFDALIWAADPDEFPDLDGLRAEVAEFATYLVLCLSSDSSPMHARVVKQLLAVRRRHESSQSGTLSAEIRSATDSIRERIPSVSLPRPALPKFRSPPVAVRLLSAVVVGVLLLIVGLRYRDGLGPPPPSTYGDIVEITGMVRAGSDVTARVEDSALGDTVEDRTGKALSLWSRLEEEADDPALVLHIQSRAGRSIATVADGSVTWSVP